MPTVYQDRRKISGLKGHVRGGLGVVVHSPHEVSTLRQLLAAVAVLPGDTLANVYRVLANAGDEFDQWAPSHMNEASSKFEEPKVAALVESLTFAEQVWSAQKKDLAELALLVSFPRPGRRLRFESKRPSLTFDYGSIRARLLTTGARLREFGVTLFPVARSRRQANLMEALRANATGTKLSRLESIRNEDLKGKSGVVIFLHGLFSTDVGTFDNFVNAFRAVDHQRSLLVSWPHDTLDPIELNAEELSEVIEDRLGASSLPIAFVCHSRGGLVARRTAVELLKVNRQWQQRICSCVTFGTPHDGAELAELGDELLGKLLLIRVGRQAGLVPLVDALWAVHDRRKLPGVTDLRPRKNGGDFLRRLRRDEGELAGRAGASPMPIFAIGGNVAAGGVAGWASRRFFGGTPHDLVVTLPSSMPSRLTPNAETTCDHFGYFDPIEMKKEHAGAAIRFLKQHFSGSAEAPASPRLRLKSPRRRPAGDRRRQGYRVEMNTRAGLG
jgi:hypothetical protein